MEDKKKDCTTLTDSDKCYDVDQPVADYGKTYKDQVDEAKGPSQEELSNRIYGDKTEADYEREPIQQNPMDRAGDVNTYQAGYARNREAVDYINKKSNEQGYKDIPSDEELDEYNR